MYTDRVILLLHVEISKSIFNPQVLEVKFCSVWGVASLLDTEYVVHRLQLLSSTLDSFASV